MTQTFQPGDVVTTSIFGGPVVGRVLYMRPPFDKRGTLVVADWKCGTDINRKVTVWQQGVPVALVDAAE